VTYCRAEINEALRELKSMKRYAAIATLPLWDAAWER